MKTLFNDGWKFYEMPLEGEMFNDGKPVVFTPDQFLDKAGGLEYNAVEIPHDWQIYHVKELYKNSVGFYKKTFELTAEQVQNRYNAIRFEGVYMNSAVWVNGKKAGEWKYGYATFEFDISDLVKAGTNEILVLAVYQNCNTRWYSGAGIFRDVTYINSPAVHLVTDGVYFTAVPVDEAKLDGEWKIKISTEVDCRGKAEPHSIKHVLTALDGTCYAEFSGDGEFTVKTPALWDINNPVFYILTTRLFDSDGTLLDELCQHCGFKHAVFTKDQGFFLNGRHVKINGVCQHHDLGALGAAFDVNALRRQFKLLKEMGVNSVRCSHNPPPSAWMDVCDQMGLMVDDEAFDMWEKPKTPFDYGNYFNDWCERDAAAWVRRDRNHPSLIMWSIGNEIYDTHVGNGYEITKRLYACVVKNDPNRNAPITIASNYMMTDGAQKCATLIDTVGYNYLERLYDEHHKKYPEWKIYGSETASTIQSRGIYHFPESLKLVTFSDGQCSVLGNCTVPWGAADTQTVIANDRDCPFSAGQYIWTGWDYIGEPTPYHSKSSFFGQIDTAGFPKDTFYLYKSEWAGKAAAPFVHLLPYWDWNEGQLIDVKAYTNADSIELFFNGKSLGRQEINHKNGLRPFGYWPVEYHKGELRAVAYDSNGKIIAEDIKRSFEDPASIILKPEDNGSTTLHFIQIMTADKNGTLVENARNYITVNVSGDAQLVGMDNGDSTDYDEYKPADGCTHTRRLFSNRLIAIVSSKGEETCFSITAASKDLPNVTLKFDGTNWSQINADNSLLPANSFVPSRKIEVTAAGSTKLDATNKKVRVTARVLPENATLKEINWNPVLKECVLSDNIQVCNKTGEGTGTETAIICAAGDGECILRCTAHNNTSYDEVLSDLPFTVSGIGTHKVDPYTLVEACRLSDWDKSNNKPKPELSLESGVSTNKTGTTWISFEKLDFGTDGSDTVHLPIFSHGTELPVEVWDGAPGTATGQCLGKYTYKHESIYNVYSENVFTLNRRLFGVHTISFVLAGGIYFHGFYFERSAKAFACLRALDANLITGDTFTKTDQVVEGIGNNVILDFTDMDFGSDGTQSLTICGKSNSENNTIHVKFFALDGTSSTQVIEFEHTSSYEEKTFPLNKIKGPAKISFVFLPGSNFDFKWFKFNSAKA